jgi:hypothetical protein
MKTTTYINKVTGDKYTLKGVKSLDKAWKLAGFACERNGWNVIDVTVKFN